MTHFSIYLEIIAAVVMIALYRITQIQQHGQLKWSNKDHDFWGSGSWLRKYNNGSNHNSMYIPIRVTQPNWYYRTLKIGYKERWFTSTWLTVFATDGYHLLQFIWLKLFYLIIANHLSLLGSNLITDSLLYSFLSVWAVLGTTLWATEQILKR